MRTKEITKAVREDLKKAFPGWKFSVSFDSFAGGSSIDLCLMSGPEEVLEGVVIKPNGKDEVLMPSRHAQLNYYMFWGNAEGDYRNNGCTLTPKGWEVMKGATEILKRYHWDKSDIQSDYFYCNFYMHICIGRWDKDYQVVKK